VGYKSLYRNKVPGSLSRKTFMSNTDCRLIFMGAHHAEGLVNPKVLAKYPVTDFGYPRAFRIRKYQIVKFLNRSPELRLPTFLKRDFAFIKCGKNSQK
jgi:hypothetical protein